MEATINLTPLEIHVLKAIATSNYYVGKETYLLTSWVNAQLDEKVKNGVFGSLIKKKLLRVQKEGILWIQNEGYDLLEEKGFINSEGFWIQN